MDGFRFTLEQKVTWRDLDILGHVNNAVYATYLENGRLEYLAAIGGDAISSFPLILADLQISFRSPAFLRETLVIGTKVAAMGTASITLEAQICERETGRLVATSRGVIVHYDYAENRSKPIPPEWRERFTQFEGRAL